MKTSIIGIWTILILVIGITKADAQVRAEVWFPAPPPPPGVIITNVPPPPPHRVVYREYRTYPRYHRHYYKSPGYRHHHSDRWYGNKHGKGHYKHPGHKHGHGRKHGHRR